jgi:serine/threonine protein kinase
MATGRLPFGDNRTSAATLVDLIRSADPTPPQDINPDISAALNGIILQVLDKDPQRRPTAAAMRQQLEQLAG